MSALLLLAAFFGGATIGAFAVAAVAAHRAAVQDALIAQLARGADRPRILTPIESRTP